MKQVNGTHIPEHAVSGTDNFAAVTPSDSTVLTGVRGIYVGGTGDLTVVGGDGATTVTFKAVPVGTVLNISPSKVKATGTTATLLVALK
jgi:hypothetical protein